MRKALILAGHWARKEKREGERKEKSFSLRFSVSMVTLTAVTSGTGGGDSVSIYSGCLSHVDLGGPRGGGGGDRRADGTGGGCCCCCCWPKVQWYR